MNAESFGFIKNGGLFLVHDIVALKLEDLLHPCTCGKCFGQKGCVLVE